MDPEAPTSGVKTTRKRPAAKPIAPVSNKRVAIAVPPPAAVESTDDLKRRFIDMFSLPQYATGVSNAQIKEHLGNDNYVQLAPIINELVGQSKLEMRRTAGSLCYTLLSDELARRLDGLDAESRLVYQAIEKGGNTGIWTKDIRLQTNLQNQALTKIYKVLENRCLIKQVKSVNAKAKKLYMLYDLTPSTELTGGVWYSDMEFDHEFIAAMRDVLLQCARRLNDGNGVTLAELHGHVANAKVSHVPLSQENVHQLVRTLVYDYLLEQIENDRGDIVYVATRKLSHIMCSFQDWGCLEPDFCFRRVVYEDGVVLDAHEPHCHS